VSLVQPQQRDSLRRRRTPIRDEAWREQAHTPGGAASVPPFARRVLTTMSAGLFVLASPARAQAPATVKVSVDATAA